MGFYSSGDRVPPARIQGAGGSFLGGRPSVSHVLLSAETDASARSSRHRIAHQGRNVLLRRAFSSIVSSTDHVETPCSWRAVDGRKGTSDAPLLKGNVRHAKRRRAWTLRRVDAGSTRGNPSVATEDLGASPNWHHVVARRPQGRPRSKRRRMDEAPGRPREMNGIQPCTPRPETWIR